MCLIYTSKEDYHSHTHPNTHFALKVVLLMGIMGLWFGVASFPFSLFHPSVAAGGRDLGNPFQTHIRTHTTLS